MSDVPRLAVVMVLLAIARTGSSGLLADEKHTAIRPVPRIASDSSEVHSSTLDSWQIGNAAVAPLVFQSSIDRPGNILSGEGQAGVDASDFRGNFTNNPRLANVGVDLYSPPEFEGGLLVFGDKVALKIGGYAKADFIYDFDPIDATDSFVTTTIPIGTADRTNARFHARVGSKKSAEL